MKLSLSKIFFLGIVMQILAIQGILMFNLFSILGNWKLKSLLHPAGLIICLIYFVFKRLGSKTKFRLTHIEILLCSYILILLVLLLYNTSSISDIYIAVREVLLIFVLIFLYTRARLSFNEWRMILKILYVLVLLNIFFIILTYVLGPEQYMKLVTGRFVWPRDEEYKFKISNIYSFWRSPALIGGSAAVGYFGLLTYFLFLEDRRYKKRIFFPLILVVLSVTRSVYLVLIIFLFFKFILKVNNLRKLEIILPYLIPLLILVCIPLYKYNLFSFHSILMRIELWFNDVNVEYNLIYGGAFGQVGGAVREQGFLAILDSYWLLMLTSTGLIGIFLILLFMIEKAGKIQNRKIILIAFFFGCFFVTISQSISFIVLFPLIFLNKNFLYEKEH